MTITIQPSKNGENTALADGHFLHSNYAPIKEAQRFVDNIKLPYNPKILIILEPGLSYISSFLKKRFPEIKIGVIRYDKFFTDYNAGFDFVLNYFEISDFETYLESFFSEEDLLSTLFISWPASSQIFKECENKIWPSIKAAMERAKTLLITRQYFEKKWLINCITFLSNLKKIISFNGKIEKDILIISSGPSIKPFINYIKENKDKFFIISLSSAISLCIKYNLKPDLCMTSDGGYWAGEHLKKLRLNDIPLAVTNEAFCPKAILQNNTILPLSYCDGISKEITEASGLNCKEAVRNGTVSGTALLFAARYGCKNIYMAGLDMAAQKGFQHFQPNELELNASAFDNRIKNKESRLTRSQLTNGSLDIYKNWFCNNDLKLNNRKVYRLIEKENKKNSLGWIKDLSLNDFSNLTKNLPQDKEKIFYSQEYQFNSKAIIDLLIHNKENEKWKKQLFPLDYVSLSHNNNEDIQNKLNKEWNKLINKISGILNEYI